MRVSDKLSQNEIDELLNALSAGEVDVKDIEDENKKKAKKYDFRRPEKFSKEQLRTLENINENLSRNVANFLSGYLRCPVDAKAISTESMIFSEFNNSISNPAIIGMVDFSPLDGRILVEMGSEIAFSMIDRILGGLGKNPIPKEKRAITEIEEVLIRSILNKIVSMMKDAWSAIVELNPRLENIETNSQFSQLISPSESIALVTININIAESEGLMNIVIPFIVIEPILANLSSKFWYSGNKKKEQTEEEHTSIESKIGKSSIEVKCVLGSSRLTVSELLNLGVGDIIVLDESVDTELKIFVGDKLKYRGMPGITKKNIAVKLTKPYMDFDEEGGN